MLAARFPVHCFLYFTVHWRLYVIYQLYSFCIHSWPVNILYVYATLGIVCFQSMCKSLYTKYQCIFSTVVGLSGPQKPWIKKGRRTNLPELIRGLPSTALCFWICLSPCTCCLRVCFWPCYGNLGVFIVCVFHLNHACRKWGFRAPLASLCVCVCVCVCVCLCVWETENERTT